MEILHALSPLILITAGIMGAMIGSFLNVCIYRLPQEHLSIVTPRSHCPNCGKLVYWYDNFPIISWLCLGGACRHCRFKISIRYTLVEIITALLFIIFTLEILISPREVSIFGAMDITQRSVALGISFYFIGVMVVTTFIDIDYRIIPDSLTYPGIILAPIISTLFPYFHQPIPLIPNIHFAGFISSILGVLIGGGSLYFIGVFGKLIFRKEAMGFGDVKLMAMVGGFLGWDAALLIFFFACLSGTVFGICSLVITKDHYLPFGPYLAAGTLVVMLYKAALLLFLFDTWPAILSEWLYPPVFEGY